MADAPKSEKQTFKRPAGPDLGPLAKSGFNVFIADRGTVGFYYHGRGSCGRGRT